VCLRAIVILLYINDLPINIHNAKLVMFADDIKVLISDSDARVLQIKIDNIVAEMQKL
jgi:fructose-specific phosphotransferase system component IIB